MNKTELVAKIAEKAEIKKVDAEKALKAFEEAVTAELVAGGEVRLVGFGTFEARTRNARTGKNPRTNEPIKIPAATVPAFKAGKAFKDAVNAAPAKKHKK